MRVADSSSRRRRDSWLLHRFTLHRPVRRRQLVSPDAGLHPRLARLEVNDHSRDAVAWRRRRRGRARRRRPARLGTSDCRGAQRAPQPDSLPFPHLPAGTPSMPKIEHVVVLMMENHSFDNLLGMVPYQVTGRAPVDGLTLRRGRVVNFNPRRRAVSASSPTHASSPCQLNGEPRSPGTRATSRYDGGATTASCAPAARSRCATGTGATCRSRTRWPSTSRSASATSARCSRRPTPTGASCSPARPPG